MEIPVTWDSFPRLQRLFAGLQRKKGEGVSRRLAITPDLLVRFAGVLPPGLYWESLFVCCVVGVFGLLRRSNLVPGSSCLDGQEKHLRREDVVFDRASYALQVCIRFSKTLRFQNRVHYVWI